MVKVKNYPNLLSHSHYNYFYLWTKKDRDLFLCKEINAMTLFQKLCGFYALSETYSSFRNLYIVMTS